MKLPFSESHPGPMRSMDADPGWGGIVIAIGFVILGILGLPIYKWFFVGALLLGAAVALLFRFTKLRDSESEPGTTRMIHADPGFVGILIAIGLVVVGILSLPIYRWFLLSALLLGSVVALILRSKTGANS